MRKLGLCVPITNVQAWVQEEDARTFEACPFAKGVDLGGG